MLHCRKNILIFGLKLVAIYFKNEPIYIKNFLKTKISTAKKCPYSEFFWSSIYRIWAEYREILCISLYSVQMRENADQNNSEYGHFLRSEGHTVIMLQIFKRTKYVLSFFTILICYYNLNM